MSVERDEFEAMKKEMAECKQGVHKDIKELKLGHKKLEEAIHGQSLERKESNEQLKAMFKKHTTEEMATIEKIFTSLELLTKQTAENTGFISSTKQNEELERRVAEKLNEINKPRVELWNRVKLSVVTTLTLGMLGAIGTGIVFIFKMYILISGGE